MAITIGESLAGFPGFLLHFAVALLLLGLFCIVYAGVTPYPEFKLIREGKVAPAISFSGAVLGFVIPLGSAIAESVSFVDMVIWALVALAAQILVFFALRFAFAGLVRDIADDRRGPAIFLGVMSVAVGMLNSACMTY